jgi:hypothetical protein
MGWTIRSSNPGIGKRLFPSQNIRQALKPSQPPIWWVSEVISPEQRRGIWLQHSMCLAPRLRISGAIPPLPTPGLHFMDRDYFTITASFVVNCVRSLIPKNYGLPLNFYDFVHTSSKPLASKLIQWNPDFTFLKGPIKMNVKSRKM